MEVTLSKIAAFENFVCRENSCQTVIQAGSSTAPKSKQTQKSLCQWRPIHVKDSHKDSVHHARPKGLILKSFDFGNQN